MRAEPMPLCHLFAARLSPPACPKRAALTPLCHLFAARFSPDDKFSKQRLICKKRFGLLPTQKPKIEL